MSNIHNNVGFKFCKFICIGKLICEKKTFKHNNVEWFGNSPTPIFFDHSLFTDSISVCKVYKAPLNCLNFCDARIYYICSAKDVITWTYIHFGLHNHLVIDDVCRETVGTVSELLAKKVSKI